MLQITVIGNIGANAEIKEINGRQFSAFRVASTSRRGGQEETTWVSVLSFYSEKLHPFLVKGQQVYVIGDGRISTFTKRDNTTSYDISIMADKLQLCGSKQPAQQQPVQNPATTLYEAMAQKPAQPAPQSPEIELLPF
jgi:single-strand DNA-binding protein